MTEQDRGNIKPPELTKEQRAELVEKYGLVSNVDVSGQMKKLRDRQGLKQSEIARRMGLDPSIPSLWEQGRRSVPLNRFLSLAEALEVTPEELLGRRGESGSTAESEPTIEVAVQTKTIAPLSPAIPRMVHSPVVGDDPDLIANHLPPPRAVASRPALIDPLPDPDPEVEPEPEDFVPPARSPLNGWTPQDWEPTDRIQDIGPGLPDGYWLDPVKLEKPSARKLLRNRLCTADQVLIRGREIPGASLAERLYRHCGKQPEFLPADQPQRFTLVETIFRRVVTADYGGLTDGALMGMFKERGTSIPVAQVTPALLSRLSDSARSYPMSRVDAWRFGR